MNYDQICVALLEAGAVQPRSTFITAVHREGVELSTAPAQRHRRAQSVADATDFYARDVTDFLLNPRPLVPDDVLSYRRRATAWAIAEVLRKHGHGPQPGGSK